MDERMRRHWAAAEASQLGRGGIAAVSAATGLARNTIRAGQRELAQSSNRSATTDIARVRRPGGGRKALTVLDPGLLAALEGLLESGTRGHPESNLLWTCKSTARLAD